jgi:hypothetical protein
MSVVKSAALVILGMIAIDFAFDSAVLFNLNPNAADNAKFYYGIVRGSYVVWGFIPAFVGLVAILMIKDILTRRNIKSVLSLVALLGMGAFFAVFLEPPQDSLTSLTGPALIPPLIKIAYGHLTLAGLALVIAVVF